MLRLRETLEMRNLNIDKYVHTCLRTHPHMHACILIFMHTYIHTDMHTYIHTYIHTCIEDILGHLLQLGKIVRQSIELSLGIDSKQLTSMKFQPQDYQFSTDASLCYVPLSF